MRGTIALTEERVKSCASAIRKVKSKSFSDMTKEEADSMATLWHEIMHNRHLITEIKRETDLQIRAMEMMNEYVARKTLPEFYKTLGASKTPWEEFMTNRSSTGYNGMVNSYDYLISRFGLDKDKVLQSAKSGLFYGDYTKQKENAVNALLEGGLKDFKRIDGQNISKKQVDDLVVMCRKSGCDTQETIFQIEQYLVDNGIIRSEE